ncbi:MAG: DUF4410 domain-containing protein [Proteobacteria bacterium]|nr:DUF4410 domain-containing protein [Pseudomonadota bacterium]
MRQYQKALVNSLSLICILSLLTACAGGSSRQPGDEQSTTTRKEIPGVEKIKLSSIKTIPSGPTLTHKYDNIIIEKFTSSQQYQNDYPNAVADCKKHIIEQILSKNTFKKVTDGTNKTHPGKNAVVSLEIINMRIVSGAARIFGGFFTGNSYMDIQLEIRDSDTKEVVHRKVLFASLSSSGESNSIFLYDRDMPSDFGQLIGEYMVKIVPANN